MVHEKLLKINFEEILDCIDTLEKKIDSTKYSGIYGVPRGGLVPAVMLAHRLNIPIVESKDITNNTLFVEDIVDSGAKTKELKQNYPNIKIATLYKRYTSKEHPTYIGKEINHDDYLVFPWEKEYVKKLN